MRIESHNLDGRGHKRTHVYDMPPKAEPVYGLDRQTPVGSTPDYWAAVTDVSCPIPGCAGIIRWYEAAYVPGYRVCDVCARHFLAQGTAEAPVLLRVGSRRGFLRSYRRANE
jgi:hypothetical protein